jgi:hypothetical protein
MISLSSQKKFAEALAMAKTANPVVQSMSEWRIFEMQQLTLTNNYAAVLERAAAFVQMMLSRRSLANDDRYFVTLARWYGQIACRGLNYSIPEELRFADSFVPLHTVSGRWKKIFPLPVHPNWPRKSR